MKRFTIGIAAACLAIGALGVPVMAAEKFTVCVEDKEDFPNVMKDGSALDEKFPGAAIEFIRLVGKKVGMEVEIRRRPWKQCIQEDVNNGVVDGALPAGYSKEREAFGVFPKKADKPDPERLYTNLTYVFYKKDGSAVEWDGKGIKGVTGPVGVPAGYSIISKLKELGLTVQEEPTLDSLKKIASGQLQLAVAMELEGDRQMVANPDLSVSVEKVGTPLLTKPYYLLLSRQFIKKNPALAEKIWDAVAEVKKSDYTRIVQKYFSK